MKRARASASRRSSPTRRWTIDWEECRAGRYDREAAVALFRELDFRSLLARLPGSRRTRGRSDWLAGPDGDVRR